MAFKCSECDTFFKEKKNLNQHLKSRHGMKPFKCGDCKNSYTNKRHLNQHMQSKHSGVSFKCKECDYTSDRMDSVKRHFRSSHVEKNLKCEQCEFVTDRYENMKRHIGVKHTLKQCNECDFSSYSVGELKRHKLSTHEPDMFEEESAFDKALYKKTWKIRGSKDPMLTFSSYKAKVRNTISHYLEKKGQMRWYLGMVVHLKKIDKEGLRINEATPGFTGRPLTLLHMWNFEDFYKDEVDKIMNDFAAYNKNGSGWIFERVVNLSISIAHYLPIAANSNDSSDDDTDFEFRL